MPPKPSEIVETRKEGVSPPEKSPSRWTTWGLFGCHPSTEKAAENDTSAQSLKSKGKRKATSAPEDLTEEENLRKAQVRCP